MKETKLAHIVRHGQTEWNAQGRFQGCQDSALTETGINHAQKNGNHLRGEGIHTIFSSPLGRAVKTSEIIAEYTNARITTVEEFSEMNFGELEGRDKAEMEKVHTNFFAEREKNPTHKLEMHFPGGENYLEVHNRIQIPVREILAAHPDGGFVIVGHESVNRMIRGVLLDLALEEAVLLKQKNNELVVIDLTRKEESVISVA